MFLDRLIFLISSLAIPDTPEKNSPKSLLSSLLVLQDPMGDKTLSFSLFSLAPNLLFPLLLVGHASNSRLNHFSYCDFIVLKPSIPL